MEIYKKNKIKETTYNNYITYYAWYIESSELGKQEDMGIKSNVEIDGTRLVKKEIPYERLKAILGYK
jgi:hypothetical protein